MKMIPAILFGSLIGGSLLASGAAAAEPSGSPGETTLHGIIRDFRPQHADQLPHVDFEVTPSGGNGPICGNIAYMLDEDGKPKLRMDTDGHRIIGQRVSNHWRDSSNDLISPCMAENFPAPGDKSGKYSSDDDGVIDSAESFAQWFRDVPGVNMSWVWSITLQWHEAGGYYEFSTNNFTPIDHKLLGNGPDEHNFYFTHEMVLEFTYDASAGQYVWFRGDDDAWIFIDGNLVMDHGGIAGSRQQWLKLDRLGLTDGETYTLRFFYAERKQPQTQFHLQTNIEFANTILPSVTAMYD